MFCEIAKSVMVTESVTIMILPYMPGGKRCLESENREVMTDSEKQFQNRGIYHKTV